MGEKKRKKHKVDVNREETVFGFVSVWAWDWAWSRNNQSKAAMQRPANFCLYDVVSNEYQRNVVQNIMEVKVCVKINLGAAFIPTSQNTCHLF